MGDNRTPSSAVPVKGGYLLDHVMAVTWSLGSQSDEKHGWGSCKRMKMADNRKRARKQFTGLKITTTRLHKHHWFCRQSISFWLSGIDCQFVKYQTRTHWHDTNKSALILVIPLALRRIHDGPMGSRWINRVCSIQINKYLKSH